MAHGQSGQIASAETIARALGKANKSGAGWSCLCPSHDDQSPSLSITHSEDGRLLVYCHAGCTQSEVIDALRHLNLWPTNGGSKSGSMSLSTKLPEKFGQNVRPVPLGAPRPIYCHPRLGEPSNTWIYHDEAGEILGYIHRFDYADGQKTFRPQTLWQDSSGVMSWQWAGFSKPFPLYGLNKLVLRRDAAIVLGEGEKAADAAGEYLQDMISMSWPHGAGSVSDVDVTPLVGRTTVHIWPDADNEGRKAANTLAQRIVKAGVPNVFIMDPPPDLPKGWDAADALAEDYPAAKVTELVETAHRVSPESKVLEPRAFDIHRWSTDRYAGPPPERLWLIDNILPLAAPCMLAAVGGVGKSMLTLELALRVASGPTKSNDAVSEKTDHLLGGPVCVYGAAVVITAEDDVEEVHRRLSDLDPGEKRRSFPFQIFIVPLPNIDCSMTLLRGGYAEPEATEAFDELRRQLQSIAELKLIVLDPLQAFVSADVNKDPTAGQFFCMHLGRLAAETGATVLATHHFRKQGQVSNPAEAREAIRGSTTLVDGLRSVYALWPVAEDKGRRVCKSLRVSYQRHRVVEGAVVKANWPHVLGVHTYLRAETGLLNDVTAELPSKEKDDTKLLNLLGGAIGDAAVKGKPYAKTGKNGVYQRRDELPLELKKRGRNRLEDLVQVLLESQQIRQCSAKGSRAMQWLDLPDGPFAKGEGKFTTGAIDAAA